MTYVLIVIWSVTGFGRMHTEQFRTKEACERVAEIVKAKHYGNIRHISCEPLA